MVKVSPTKNKLQLSLFASPHSIKIKAIRKKLNMSQDRFGKKVGVSGKTVSAYETGKCIPPLRILEKISKAYDTSFIAIDATKKTELLDKITLIKNVIYELEDRLVG
jgi:transcriptional regulator with XRE-family HTH domain